MSVFNILFIVFWTFFIASAALEVIGYNKRNLLMEQIAKPCLFGFLLLSSLMLLIPNIPDSTNIIIFVSVALCCGLAGSCIQFVPKTKKTVVLSSGLFILGVISYTYLFIPSYRLFPLPGIITAAVILIYFGLLAAFYYFIIGKRELIKTVGILAFMLPLIFMHYSALITLIGQPKLYSILLFIGSSVYVASQVFIVKGFFKPSSDRERLARMILYIAGQFFVTAGFTLMVCF